MSWRMPNEEAQFAMGLIDRWGMVSGNTKDGPALPPGAVVERAFDIARLTFAHPLTGETVRCESSLPPAIDPATGWFQNEPLKTKQPWISNEGKTLTQGAVLKPTRWLNVFYNQSDSFTPAGISPTCCTAAHGC